MPRELKLSSPLNISAELRRARRESSQADQLAERAVMRAFEVYRTLKFSKNQTLTPDGEEALERLDRATEALGEARQSLGDAAYQIEQILKTAGEEP